MADSKHPLRSTLWIFGAIFIGIGTGLVLGKQAAVFGDLGKLFIQLIKAFAIPLLIFAILEALLTTAIRWSSAARLLFIVGINATIAATIGLTLSNWLRPGDHLHLAQRAANSATVLKAAEGKQIDLMGFVKNIIPESILEPIATNNVLSLVFVTLLVGLALRTFKNENAPWVPQVEALMEGGLRVSEKLMIWLVKLTPIAVFGVIAKTVGESGFEMFRALFGYLTCGLLGLTLQILIVYQFWIKVICKRSLREYWAAASEPLLFSFGINSSLATLPLTLKALDKLGVSKESSRLSACIGTNLNNDGILLYEAMAVLFVTQSLGMHLPIGQQINVAILCVITAIGIAGVPEAGIISLAVILSTMKIPAEILPILLIVDWIIARMRSVTNVSADLTVALALDALAPKSLPQESSEPAVA